MDKNSIISDIDNKIADLGSLQTIFGLITNRFDGYVTLDKIDKKITSLKRYYYLYLGVSIVLAGLLTAACFAKLLDLNFLDLSKSALLILLTLSNGAMMFRHRSDLEKIKTIQFLLELKNKIE
jgi:hypothetical protein